MAPVAPLKPEQREALAKVLHEMKLERIPDTGGVPDTASRTD
jgi:hypothetical protein